MGQTMIVVGPCAGLDLSNQMVTLYLHGLEKSGVLRISKGRFQVFVIKIIESCRAQRDRVVVPCPVRALSTKDYRIDVIENQRLGAGDELTVPCIVIAPGQRLDP